MFSRSIEHKFVTDGQTDTGP